MSTVDSNAESSQLPEEGIVEGKSDELPTGTHEDNQTEDSSQGEGPRSPPPGYLTLQNGGRSRYVSETFWANIDNEVG